MINIEIITKEYECLKPKLSYSLHIQIIQSLRISFKLKPPWISFWIIVPNRLPRGLIPLIIFPSESATFSTICKSAWKFLEFFLPSGICPLNRKEPFEMNDVSFVDWLHLVAQHAHCWASLTFAHGLRLRHSHSDGTFEQQSPVRHI